MGSKLCVLNDHVLISPHIATGLRVIAFVFGCCCRCCFPFPSTAVLAGKSPLIVFADAALDNAVSGALNGNFYASGQVRCVLLLGFVFAEHFPCKSCMF